VSPLARNRKFESISLHRRVRNEPCAAGKAPRRQNGSLIAPRGGTATIGGIMNFLNNIMGVVAPITTGYIVGATHSFTGAFLTAGIVLVVGIVAYVFILGRLEPIADPPAA
jgi:hypothetical protein